MRGFGFIGALVLVVSFIAGAIGFGPGQNTVPVPLPAAGGLVVWAHGGEISMTSEPSRGTTVSFTRPAIAT
ncbi:MAG TPA: hypothetical protein VM284_03420 [Candidatus Limnocylindria bacterium]|nr:hypothetical protein [Candidatus Limnocylindria bacterium]